MGNAVDIEPHWYNIVFTLGDRWADGHGGYETFHMRSNYAPGAIKIAYIQASKLLGFDFIKECCSEYEEYYIKPEYTKVLIDKGIIDKEHINKDDNYIPIGAYWVGESGSATDEFVDIFIKIVRLINPNFILEDRNLQEESLDILEGAGYGITEPN